MAWTDILEFRDYWDVPRIFLVRHRDQLMLFDCPFDEEIEDFLKEYRVYLMPELKAADLSGSWEFLASKAVRALGTIPVREVVFDPTNRKSVRSDLLDQILSVSSDSRAPALPVTR